MALSARELTDILSSPIDTYCCAGERGASLVGAAAVGTLFVGSVIALTLRKHASVTARPAADYRQMANSAYETCYTGNATWSDIYDSCQKTTVVQHPGLNCSWGALWFMVDRTPTACVIALAQLESEAMYRRERNGTLEWLGMLVALPFVMIAGLFVGSYAARLYRCLCLRDDSTYSPTPALELMVNEAGGNYHAYSTDEI